MNSFFFTWFYPLAMDKIIVSHQKKQKKQKQHSKPFLSLTFLCSMPWAELCILTNLKTVDGSLRCLYNSTCTAEAMTDGSTCGTKAIWTDGWRDEWTDRWMEGWRKVDRDDKWAEDECCSPSHTKNTWLSKPSRWQHNLSTDSGSVLHPMDSCNSSMVMSHHGLVHHLRDFFVANVLRFCGPLQWGQDGCAVCKNCQWRLA